MLSNLVSSGKDKKRIGRGGSRGGTSGKGHKGQKARSGGKVSAAFEGGQMPLTRRLPKRGFTNARFKRIYTVIQLGLLEKLFEKDATITKQELVEKRIIKNNRELVKILSGGEIEKRFVVVADAFSKTAAEQIVAKGGEANLIKDEVKKG